MSQKSLLRGFWGRWTQFRYQHFEKSHPSVQFSTRLPQNCLFSEYPTKTNSDVYLGVFESAKYESEFKNNPLLSHITLPHVAHTALLDKYLSEFVDSRLRTSRLRTCLDCVHFLFQWLGEKVILSFIPAPDSRLRTKTKCMSRLRNFLYAQIKLHP